jgi:hypothetical protein
MLLPETRSEPELCKSFWQTKSPPQVVVPTYAIFQASSDVQQGSVFFRRSCLPSALSNRLFCSLKPDLPYLTHL